MKKNKLLFILLPVIIVIAALIGGIVYITLNGTPKKIFEHSINKVFSKLEIDDEKIDTCKISMELSADIDSEEEEIKELADALKTAKIELNVEEDFNDILIKCNTNVIYENESLLNLDLLLQDEKMYVAFKDWLDKYLEIPEDSYDISEITNAYNNQENVDTDTLIKVLKEEILNEVSKQEFSSEKVSVKIDGKDTKVNKSILTFNEERFVTFIRELFTNLKNNSNFQTALGSNKDEILDLIDGLIEDLPTDHFDTESTIAISIYTKGLLNNQMIGIDFTAHDGEETIAGIELMKTGENKYQFLAYENDDGEKYEAFKVVFENVKENKNKGTAIISFYADDEEFELKCDYEKNKNQTIFKIYTEVEEVAFTISGNLSEDGNKYTGNCILSAEIPDYETTINFNMNYNIEYNVKITKEDVSNSVLIEEISEEDQEKLMESFEKSKLYDLVSSSPLFNDNLLEQNSNPLDGFNSGIDRDESVKKSGYTITYNVPASFTSSPYNSEYDRYYTDEYINSVNAYIYDMDIEEYLDGLDDEYVLESEYYENQTITGTSTHEVNGKEYKYRTIKYNSEYSSYLNLYFAYKLDNNTTYIVEVETENGTITMDDINRFLNVEIKKDAL